MFQLATTASAVEEAFAAGKVASLIGIEGTVCFCPTRCLLDHSQLTADDTATQAATRLTRLWEPCA